MTNNYNNNKNNTSIACNVAYYDNSYNYTENFQSLIQESYYKTSVLFYTDYGNYDNIDLLDLLDQEKIKKDLKGFYDEFSYFAGWEGNYIDNLSGYIRKYFKYKDFKNKTKEQKKQMYCEKMLDSFEDTQEIISELVAAGFNSKFLKDNFKLHESRGYSQGDFIYVIYQAEYEGITKYIDNLLWDSEATINIKIDDIEINNSDYELLADSFKYDKNEVIDNILKIESIQELKNSEYIKEQLNKLLPEYPEYR